jgi:hypothetical protein
MIKKIGWIGVHNPADDYHREVAALLRLSHIPACLVAWVDRLEAVSVSSWYAAGAVLRAHGAKFVHQAVCCQNKNGGGK